MEPERGRVRVRLSTVLHDELEGAVGEKGVVVVLVRRLDGGLLVLCQLIERVRRRALGLVRREEVALVQARQPRHDADEAPEGREFVGVLARGGRVLAGAVGRADVLERGREEGGGHDFRASERASEGTFAALKWAPLLKTGKLIERTEQKKLIAEEQPEPFSFTRLTDQV